MWVGGGFREVGEGRQPGGREQKGAGQGSAGWVALGRFNATPGNAHVPLAGGAPEDWEFAVRAVRRDAEIGLQSDSASMIIRG